MWATIFAAVTQLATTFITLFSATNKFAKALDHLGDIAEQSAGVMADESLEARKARRAKAMAETAQAISESDSKVKQLAA